MHLIFLSFLAHMTFTKRIIAYAIMTIQLQVVCGFFLKIETLSFVESLLDALHRFTTNVT